MEDRETPRMHKYVESKMTRNMMATVRHITAWAGRTKFQAAWFLLNSVQRIQYNKLTQLTQTALLWTGSTSPGS